jgi:replicative DNA helicase
MSLDLTMLHYALKNKKYLLELTKSVQPTYFAGPFAEFYAIQQAAVLNPNIKEPLGLPALMDYCDRQNLAPKKDVFKKIYQDAQSLTIQGSPPVDSDFSYFIGVFKERYNSVVVKDAIRRMSGLLTAGIPVAETNKLMEATLTEIHSITRQEVLDEGSVGQDVVNIFREYEAIAANPNQFRGVLSGFPSLDAITNGFNPGELILLGGFAGTGKSLLCMNMAINAWLGSNTIETDLDNFATDGKNVLYFTLEMPRSNRGEISSAANLNKRIISCVGRVPNTEMRKGALDEAARERFKNTCRFIKRYDQQKKLYVVDMPRGVRMEDLESKYLELRDQFRPDLVIVDYLGLMETAEDDADHESQGKIAAKAHEFARVYEVPVISPVQLNRPGVANHSLSKQNYNTTRISRSDRVGHNANIIMMIECRDNERSYPDMPIHFAKLRDGDGQSIILMKDFNNLRVYDSLTADPAPIEQFVDLGGADD